MKSFFLPFAAFLASATAAPFADANVIPQFYHQLSERDLPAECTNYSSVSAGTVCIRRPTDCTASYTAVSGETCTSLRTAVANVTATQLYKWNPEIDRNCFGLHAYVPLCINAPGYTFEGQPKGGDLAPAAAEPVPIMPGISIPDCKVYAYIDPTGAPRSQELLAKNNLSTDTFLKLNPRAQLNVDGTIVYWAGYYVCVGGQQANQPPPTIVAPTNVPVRPA